MTGRSIGVAVAAERLLPPAVREAFGLLTALGDAGVLLAVVALCYWFDGRERERAAFALAATLGATALTLALKGLFALPRPPSALHLSPATGYGFPSGHALAAAAAWGALALDRGRGRARAAVAGVVVAVVATSRVVIGVHYAVDVVVGVLVGLAYLAALVRIAEWRAGRAFAAAAVLAVAAVVTNGPTPDVVAPLAGTLGAGATWAWVETPPEETVGVGLAVVGLAVLGAVGYAGNALGLGLPAVFGLNLVVPAGILALPLAVERARTRGSVSPT